MTASLPQPLRDVFSSFVTTEYTTVDSRGTPITWPVTPYYRDSGPVVSITTGLGYPKKANDARENPKVALLFSDPTGCGLADPATVLVQGIADVDDRDLDANRRRYGEESIRKLPATASMLPPERLQRFADWYFTRIYVHVRPERIYVWRAGEPEPELYGSHVDEQRSHHNEEPEVGRAGPEGGGPVWDPRIDELGRRYSDAVLSLVAPDGFPFSARLPVSCDRSAGLVRIAEPPLGMPVEPGLACLTAHDHAPDFTWQRNFQIRGDLVVDEQGLALAPHRLVGGFELPPTSMLGRLRLNAGKIRRFRRIAKRELARHR